MKPRSIIRWQHRLNREHPTCTERQSLIEEYGWKGGDSGDSGGEKQHDQQIPKPIPLTPTGMLMEGDCTTYPGNLQRLASTSVIPLFTSAVTFPCSMNPTCGVDCSPQG